jgi:hypothetical protein
MPLEWIRTADNVTSNSNSNPFSTSGSGITFEQLVGTYYLVSLLSQEIPRGIDCGICKEVRFQQRWAGCLLDDIVVVASDGTREMRLAIQVKHDLTISDATTNTVCAEVIDACWKTFNSALWNFNRETDRLCIALGISQPRIDKHFKPILEWARTSSSSAEFLQKVSSSGFSSREKQDYLTIMRNLLGRAKGGDLENDELWQFLKCLVILDFDLEAEGSRDTTYCWNRLLSHTRGRDYNQAISLFNELNSIVKEYSRSAGSITQQILRAKIGSKVQLSDAPNFGLDLANLRKHTNIVLASINDAIGLKIKLPRTEKVDEIESLVKQSDVVIISDEPMTGKSVLLKLFANRLRSDGEIIAFSVARFTGSTLSAFLQSIQITNDLASILSAIGSAPLRCILIDGLERAKDEDKKRILNDLIISVGDYNKSILDAKGHKDNCWRIVCTCRSSETQNIVLHTEFRKNLASNSLKTIELGRLSNEEINEVSTKFPALADLVSQDNLQEFMSMPLILDILTLPNITLSSKPLPSKITESWLLDWYWKEIVRLGEGTRYGMGHPDQRESIMLTLVMKSLEGEIVHLSDISEAEAVSGLISDRLLLREGDILRFAHDVIEDWTLAILLKYNEKNLFQFLLKFNDSLSLTRPFTLYLAHVLEYDQSSDFWFNLLTSLEKEKGLSPRWRQSALTVPLTSPMLPDVLPTIQGYLFENSTLLSDFLKVMRTICVTPDPSVYSVLYGLPEEALEQYLAYWTTPNADQWIPIIELLLEKQEIIKGKVLVEFSFICEKWMTRSVNDTNQSLRRKIATFSLSILNNGLLEEYEDQPKNRFILSALYAANCLAEDLSQFVRTKALRGSDHKTWGFEELILEQGWIPICSFLPEVATDLLKAILCINPKNERLEYHNFFELGIRHNHWNPPTYLEGPFLGFLRMHEERGLELITAVVNHATEVWKKREEYHNRQPLPQILKLDDKNIELWGDEHVYQWYRFPSVAPDTITCALMALEYWLNEQIKNNKKTPQQLFRGVLIDTKSIVTVGVCGSVALANMDVCQESILPILENPAFWITDKQRLIADSTAANSTQTFSETFSLNKQQEKNNYRILLELAKQPHRKLDFRDFILRILLGPKVLSQKLLESMRDFPNRIPIFFEEEKQISELLEGRLDDCKILAAQAEIKNYEILEINGQVVMQFKMPLELEEEQRERTKGIEKNIRLYGFLGWVLTLFNSDKIVSFSEIDSAFTFANELTCEDNPSYQPNGSAEYSELRADAIAAFAAAIVINNWQWIHNYNKSFWFKKQLLTAATRPGPLSEVNDVVSIFPMGYRRSAAGSNTITKNNFFDCRLTIWASTQPLVDGNYWSEYTTRYPNAKEIGNTGVWDTPYEYWESVVDNHPLTKPISTTIPEFPSLIFVLPLIIAVSVGMLVYFKKRKN